MWESQHLTSRWSSTACHADSFIRDEYTKDFKCPQKYKSSGFKSSEHGGQAICLPKPIYQQGACWENRTEMCGSTNTHEVKSLTNDQWHVDQEISHDVFQDSFVILSCKPVWKYVGSEQITTTNTGPDIDGEPMMVMGESHLPADGN
jgi:hypothetical protein